MRIPFAFLSISVAAFMTHSAQAQDWVQWDTASGGNGHWYKAVINTNGLNWTQVDQLARIFFRRGLQWLGPRDWWLPA
jgi:hypothetical protein